MRDNDDLRPCRPYLLNAYLDWLLDNELTPHLLIDATVPLVQVPQEYVEDGRIVLDIAQDAVTHFKLEPEAISFEACFGEQEDVPIYLPMASVMGIHAKEMPVGTLFPEEPCYTHWIEEQKSRPIPQAPTLTSVTTEQTSSETTPPDRKGPPHLRVIK